MNAMAAIGRPPDWPFDPEIAAAVVDRYREGITLKRIGEMDGFPPRQVIYRWMDSHPDFRASVSRAKADHADSLADETVDIVDTDVDPQRAWNRVRARHWAAAKLKPEQYGEKIDINHKHSISITAAIDEASGRLALPMRYQADAIDAEVTELTALPVTTSPDHGSAVPETANNCQQPDEADYDPFA